MKTILILTHTTDDTASMVIDHLNTMDCRPIRFNTDKFHKEIKTNLKMSEKGKFNCYFKFNDGLILPFEEVSITWNRRIHNPDIERIFSQEELNNWLEDEVQWGMNISFTLLNCPIVNPWEVNERLKFNKMYQMKIAANLGLEVPKSLITNLDSEITIFWSEIKRNMIFKKIKKGLFNFKNGKRFILHTNKIDPEKFDKNFIDRMKFTPVFLQEHIHKKYDIRSIVIDDSVYSFAIHSQENPLAIVDYRTAGIIGDLNSLKHEVIDLGNEVNSKILAFTKYFGLTFSAFDFILTKDDRLVFLEDNPNGQWAWLELKTSFPLSKKFALALNKLGV